MENTFNVAGFPELVELKADCEDEKNCAKTARTPHNHTVIHCGNHK